MNIVIGKSAGNNVPLDIERLLSTRLLIQANSGKGKSWLLRRIAEQLFGKVPVIILDPEGEFATLREKFGYVLVGKGGETPADPRSAALVAQKLLELRASAVCDLYEMKPSARHEWVRNFCEALIDAPKNLWHSCVIVIDEAHTFCPEKGAGESIASESVIGLSTRGRKRGFALILATQRLGKLRKDAAAELLNVMIGGTFIDIDRKRAADALGVYGKDQHQFFDEIKLLKRGLFYALGPAIADERILVEVGAIETTHPEAGSAKHAAGPPPAPDAIAKLLPKLSDLPKAAEEKAKTEAELHKQIRELKTQLRSQPAGKPVEVKVADPRAVERALAARDRELKPIIAKLAVALDKIRNMASDAGRFVVPDAKQIPAGEIKKQEELLTTQTGSGVARTVTTTARTVQTPRPDAASNGDSDLTPYQLDILRSLAMLEAIGRNNVPNALAAVAAGKSGTSSTWERYRGKLQAMGLIMYPSPGRIKLTDFGREQAPQTDAPLTSDELQDQCKGLLTPYQVDLLTALIEAYPHALTREDLGEKSAKQSTSSTFERYVGQLKGMEIITYPTPRSVKASDWLFLD